jgi:hypothetical protein
MMIRKNLIIVVLATFCLTATLFLTKLPVSQSKVKNTLQVQALDTRKSTVLYAADAMWVEPNQSTYGGGSTFNITVWMNITEDVSAYQIGLHYNGTQLKCTRAGFTGGVISSYFLGHSTSNHFVSIDGVLGSGSILAFESCASPGFVPGPNSASLIWAEFQVLIVPGAGNLSSKFDISWEYPIWTWVLDRNLNDVNITPYDGYFAGELVHDVAVTNVASSKTLVCQGFCADITVTVANQGDFAEDFSVTAYANTTLIESQIVSLLRKSSATISFTWNTTGFAKGNYAISAYALPVPGENNTADNNFTDGWVFVSMIGDLTGPTPGVPDGKCDIRDIALVAKAFGSAPGLPGWNPNCDITGPDLGVPDGKVDIRDIALVAKHFGEVDP